jgi:hypothetical protein
MRTGRLGGEAQKVDRFRGLADTRQAVRAAARHMLTEIQGAPFRERAQQPQFVEFF